MYSLQPSLDNRDACKNLGKLLTADINTNSFRSAIRRLQRRFDLYAANCPAPYIAPGVIVNPEIRIQSELYLPMDEIASVFTRLYCSALNYPPILSSTPFHNSLSWADTFVELPPYLQFTVNPALLLEKLLTDRDLLTEFLFASFLPRRFYGAFGRYPEQQKFIREWLKTRKTGIMHCLDSACGTGEETYGLALLLSDEGFSPDEIRVDGWTLEPLEVWAAAHRRFPHDRRREALFREETSELFEQGFQARIRFRCVDLTEIPLNPPLPQGKANGAGLFDLILCNGLLGGPIIHGKEQLELTVSNLANLLAPDGVLLAADNFHGGWKQKCPQKNLRALFEEYGLKSFDAGEGIGGLKL